MNNIKKPDCFKNDPYEPEVCRSHGGFYIGTKTPEGMPYARWSKDRWKTREEAEDALDEGTWTPVEHP